MKTELFDQRIIEVCGNKSIEQYKFMKNFEKKIMEQTEGSRWHVFRDNHTPTESGVYLTLRCGLNGIYQTWNVWEAEKKKWLTESLDGSFIIMYKDIEPELEKIIKRHDSASI